MIDRGAVGLPSKGRFNRTKRALDFSQHQRSDSYYHLLNCIAKSRYKTIRGLSRHLAMDVSHLSNFLARRYHKVGRAKRKLIRQFFIEQGWLPAPRPRPKCICIICGKVHTRGRHPQQQTVQKTAQEGRNL